MDEVKEGVDFYDVPVVYDHPFAHLNDAVEALGPLTYIAQVEDLLCCSAKWMVLESLPSGYTDDPDYWPELEMPDGHRGVIRCWVSIESAPWALVIAHGLAEPSYFLVPLAEVGELSL